jgi:hypothetical protein
VPGSVMLCNAIWSCKNFVSSHHTWVCAGHEAGRALRAAVVIEERQREIVRLHVLCGSSRELSSLAHLHPSFSKRHLGVLAGMHHWHQCWRSQHAHVLAPPHTV